MSKGQMLLWQLKSVPDIPWNLPLKFGQKRVSNSWDIDNIEVFLGRWVFKVIFVSNLQLQFGVVWVVTTSIKLLPFNYLYLTWTSTSP